MVLLGISSSAWAQEPEPDSLRADSLPRVTLAPVMVTVTRADAPLGVVPYAVTALSGATMLRGRAADGLDELLVGVPGVFAANRYNYALDQRLAIRGFGARSAFGVRGVKVLLDGIPQTLPDGQGQLTNVELGDIERIEVLRGASSALYGNAAGGVVNLRSRVERPRRPAVRFQLTTGSDLFRKALAGLGAPLGAGAIHVSGSWTATDGFREHSEADLGRGSVRIQHPLTDRGMITFHAHLAHMPLAENPGALTQEELDSVPSQAAARNLAVDARKRVTQAQGGVSLRHRFGRGASLDVAVFGVRRTLENPLTFGTIDLGRWGYGARSSLRLPLPLQVLQPEVTLGFDAQWQRDDRLNFTTDGSQRTLDQDERVRELGPFVQLLLTPASSVTLVGGVRYDRVRFEVADRLPEDGDQSGATSMGAVSVSGGVVFRLLEQLAPWASVSTAFETPTTTELVNRLEGGGGLNPGLEPQRATNYEVGVRGSLRPVLRYEAVVFHSDVRDALIPFEVPSEPGRRFFRNAGSIRHRGVELGVDVLLPSGLSARGTYTYARNRFREFRTEDAVFDGNAVPGVPRHRAYLTVGWVRPRGAWGLVEHTYTAAYHVDDANAAQVQSYHVSNVRGGWVGDVGRVRFRPFLAVLNVLDERYAASAVVNARGGRYFEPAPGRNFLLGLGIEY
jgi:iron complex outermembrane receptor protein